MRRQFIWMQAALCAVTFSVAAPMLARANGGQPPPHAQANGKYKAKKAKKAKQAENRVENRVENRTWDPRFRGLDRNSNNVVSRAEWNGDDRSFANHDWNRDGVLSGDELIAGATRPTTTRLPAPRTSRPHTESDEVLFARMDSNRDQRLSRSEWTGSASEFDRLDFNKDGVLSPYEFGVGR